MNSSNILHIHTWTATQLAFTSWSPKGSKPAKKRLTNREMNIKAECNMTSLISRKQSWFKMSKGCIKLHINRRSAGQTVKLLFEKRCSLINFPDNDSIFFTISHLLLEPSSYETLSVVQAGNFHGLLMNWHNVGEKKQIPGLLLLPSSSALNSRHRWLYCHLLDVSVSLRIQLNVNITQKRSVSAPWEAF